MPNIKLCKHGILGIHNCRPCVVARAKIWKQANPEKVRAINRRWRINGGEEVKIRLRASQRKSMGTPGGFELKEAACACCGKFAKLDPDHSHETGQARDWICRGCNLFLGRLEKYAKNGSLSMFLEYLTRWGVKAA